MPLANDSVQKTLCMPLWARAIGARTCPQLLPDHDAPRILSELGVGEPPALYRLQYFSTNVVIRHWNVAQEILAYLADHPEATIVELGCGLSCQRRQMAAADMAGARNPWYAIDLPDVMRLRWRLVPTDCVERQLSADLNDHAWMDQIDFDPARGIFFTAAGLFYYFKTREVRDLLCALARRFPGGAIAFDIASAAGAKGVNKEIELSGIDARVGEENFAPRDPKAELEAWDPALANVEERHFFDGYLDPHTYRRSPLTRVAQWVLQTFRLGFFVHIDFADVPGTPG